MMHAKRLCYLEPKFQENIPVVILKEFITQLTHLYNLPTLIL